MVYICTYFISIACFGRIAVCEIRQSLVTVVTLQRCVKIKIEMSGFAL